MATAADDFYEAYYARSLLGFNLLGRVGFVAPSVALIFSSSLFALTSSEGGDRGDCDREDSSGTRLCCYAGFCDSFASF